MNCIYFTWPVINQSRTVIIIWYVSYCSFAYAFSKLTRSAASNCWYINANPYAIGYHIPIITVSDMLRKKTTLFCYYYCYDLCVGGAMWRGAAWCQQSSPYSRVSVSVCLSLRLCLSTFACIWMIAARCASVSAWTYTIYSYPYLKCEMSSCARWRVVRRGTSIIMG